MQVKGEENRVPQETEREGIGIQEVGTVEKDKQSSLVEVEGPRRYPMVHPKEKQLRHSLEGGRAQGPD